MDKHLSFTLILLLVLISILTGCTTITTTVQPQTTTDDIATVEIISRSGDVATVIVNLNSKTEMHISVDPHIILSDS
jgi:flagellar basal body-associated protein FliL